MPDAANDGLDELKNTADDAWEDLNPCMDAHFFAKPSIYDFKKAKIGSTLSGYCLICSTGLRLVERGGREIIIS